MSSVNSIVRMFIFPLLFIFNSIQAQDIYTVSVDSTTYIFGRTVNVVNWKLNDTLLESNFLEIVNDTVYTRGDKEPGQQPQPLNHIHSPLFPQVGMQWDGFFDGPSTYEVVDYQQISVPAGSFNAYIYEISDSITGTHKATLTFAANVGGLSMMIFNSDTFSVVLNSYSLLGGYGVYPLHIGNEWEMMEGTYVTDINEINISNLNTFLLAQNYPNPFNPVTTIKYQIPKISFVTLKIYDVLGNEITTLVNQEKPSGRYEVEFDALALPSGIYFYKLQAGSFVQTKKMVLMK